MKTQYKVLKYRIDLYFHDYKLAIKIDEIGHCDRNIGCKINRQKAIEQELGCKFIRINSDKEGFDIFRAINEIFRGIKQLPKITLIIIKIIIKIMIIIIIIIIIKTLKFQRKH